ncbi:F-box protein [Moelleriella libera RCEF 2490]|uniref:F-box protein n=1 Tax=Moelleriella libera RCEF 2490 TaxID=1081109 RepID=A0A162IIP6_9HYPO|nr:F-box protein [Moelleriella libera RCEF 2490]
MAESSTHAAAMDPPHITEFASDRYFEKLSQLNASQHSQQQQRQRLHPVAQRDSSHFQSATPSPAAESSTFILPLREAKGLESDPHKQTEQKRNKGRFFNLRQKASFLHSRPQNDAVTPSPVLQSLGETTHKSSAHFDHLFLALPNELQIQILSSLPLTDVLTLRLASKTWHALITVNEAPIARHHLESHVPAYALRLYPVNDQSDISFHYLCSLWHRLHVAAKLAHLMCQWITKEIFLRQTEAQQAAFAPQRERMRRRLIPLLFTTFHFFETYRNLHLKHIVTNGGHGLQREPYTLNPIEAEVMNMYDDQTLLRVHEVFPLVISSFCRRLRPPTYVGRVERSLRGYLRERPSDEVHSAILCIGGLRQVERLWEIKGYNNRRSAVDQWHNSLTKDMKDAKDPKEATPGHASSKPRLSLKSFGRKKSLGTGDRAPAKPSSSDGASVPRHSDSMDAQRSDSGYDSDWIFHTSLAADMPMSHLSHENAQALLDDLPVLQQIWLTTAEAMILDRGIVQRPQDIRRNQQVMLELIREDGLDEEDEWWYGRTNPDSVRPSASAIDDAED